MAETQTKATFKMLRSGEWGIRVVGPAPSKGDTVTVSLSAGGEKQVTVANVVARFDDATLCAIVDDRAAAAVRTESTVTEERKPSTRRAPTTVSATKSAVTPTGEQQNALSLFSTGQSIAIEAGAGTGKTSTCVLCAQSTTRRGQYVAFNRKIVEDSATKFPRNVRCNTAHSLAWKAIVGGTPFQTRLDSSARMKSTELANILRTEPMTVTKWDGEKKQLGYTFLAGLAMGAVERFCMSADAEPLAKHVPLVDGLDAPMHEQHGPARYPVNNDVAKALLPAVKRAWKDLCRYDGALPFKPSHYLKMWQLGTPVIDVEFILFDEAQDATPVMINIIRQQADRGVQVVWVGDSQQEIYGWAGAINALATVPAEQRAFLTQSFRFGDAIAATANVCLGALNAELRLKGFDKVKSRVEALDMPRAVLCRTNAAAVRTVLDYLRRDLRPFLVGGGKDVAAFCRAARDLQQGRRAEHPELACFDSWGEVQEYVETDEQGADLKLMVSLIDEFGVDTILDAVDPKRMPQEEDADVVVSTAHKSKGLEWDSVRLAADFKDAPSGEELRLLYVAVTRAKLVLDITAVGYFAPAATTTPTDVED